MGKRYDKKDGMEVGKVPKMVPPSGVEQWRHHCAALDIQRSMNQALKSYGMKTG
jgi:hypothetical protein